MTTSATPSTTPLGATPGAEPAPRGSGVARLVRIVVSFVVAFVVAYFARDFVSQLWNSRTPDGHDISHPCDLVRPELMNAVTQGATPTEQPPTKLATGGTYYSCRYEVAGRRAVQIGATETEPNKATPKDIVARALALLRATNIHDINDFPDAAAATYTDADGTQRLIICKNEQSHLRIGYVIAGDPGRAGTLPEIGQLLNASL